MARAAAVIITALFTLMVVAPAQGASLTHTYSCLYPLISSQPLTVEVSAEFPDEVRAEAEIAPRAIEIVGTTNEWTWDGFQLVQATTLEGSARLSMAIRGAGVDQSFAIPLVADEFQQPARRQPLMFRGHGQTPALHFPFPGRAEVEVALQSMNLRARKADGTSVIFPPTPGVPDSDGNPETFDVPCALSPSTQSSLLATIDATFDPPPPPGPPRNFQLADDVTPTTATLSWDPPDDWWVRGYELHYDDVVVDVGNVTTATLTGLRPDSEYFVTVLAYGVSGPSEPSEAVLVLTPPLQDHPEPPTPPTNLRATATPRSVALTWDASVDNVGVTGYDVFQDGVLVRSVGTETSTTITGLTPETVYRFKVRAKDAAGAVSPFSAELTVSTPQEEPATARYAFALRGTSLLRTLTRGPVPLTGGFAAELTLATGVFSGDLVLSNTRARLIALGFVPVTADLAFVMTSKTTGKLQGGAATATARFKVRLPKLYLFGSIPIAGGVSCQTKTASVASLASVGSFDPLAGGRLQGTYGLSDLTGCGALTSFISPLTKGTGNTIDITLAPQSSL